MTTSSSSRVRTDLGYKVACPSCQGTNVRNVGKCAPTNVFAGRELDELLDGGCLWRCDICNLRFRFPRHSKERFDELYRAGSSENWHVPAAHRNDWDLVRRFISTRPDVRRVLDVGCFDGRLLEYLGPGYERLGIEIHPGAARMARGRGVTIVGKDFTSLADYLVEVDAAIAVDVIEHAFDPLDFLRQMARTVKAGGFLLVSTGNTSALSWRLMGSKYWYATIGEHLSFINPNWCRYAASRLALGVASLTRFSHAHANWHMRLQQASANLFFRTLPGVFGWLRSAGFGGLDARRFPGLREAPPGWMASKDHIFVVFRKQ